MKKWLGGGGSGARTSRRLRGGADGSRLEDDAGQQGVEGPTGERLNRVYAQLLEELAIPEAKRELMIANETDDKKRALIKAHSAMLESEGAPGGKSKKKPAAYWVDLISRRKGGSNEPVITVKEAGELYAVLRTAHKQFLTDFIDAQGVETLIDLTRFYTGRDSMREAEKKILPQIMSCYKALMNNNTGMEAVLNVPDSITSFALGMDLSDQEDLATAQEVVMLLAVTCFYSPEGRETVVSAMDDLRVRWREKQRFQTLVETFAECSNNEFRASVSMLITTVVNSASRVEDRVRVRNDFLSLDIMGIFERVLAEALEEDDESYQVIATQYQVFEDMLAEDHKEVTFALISGTSSLDDAEVDLSSQQDVFEYLMRSAEAAGCADLLLETTQSLLLIPAERSLAVPTWEGVSQFVREATDYQRRTGKGLRLNYQILSELLDKRAELDERLGQMSSGEDVIGRQRERIKELERTLREDGPGSKGGKGGKKGSKKGGDAAAGGAAGSRESASSEEVTILQGQIEQLRQEITALQKKLAASNKGRPVEDNLEDKDAPSASPSSYKGKLDSTGLAPAGLVPGVKLGGIPACPLPNMPGSLELAPIPAKSGAKTKGAPAPSGGARGGGGGPMFAAAAAAAAKNKGGSGSGVSMKGAGQGIAGMLALRAQAGGPPGAAGAGGAAGGGVVAQPKETEAEIRKRLGLPRKKPITPSVKMRSLFWNPIPVEKLEGTVWCELSDQKVKFDVKRLERKFGKDAEAEKALAAKDAKRKSLGRVHLVTGKRQQNIGIAISKIHLSNKEIADAIWQMDETLLSPEHTVVLLTSVPTEDEVELVRNFEETGGDKKQLAREDQFVRVMSKIPRLQARLQAVSTKHNFDYDCARIDERVTLVHEACQEIRKSRQLSKLLELILALGNYLNGGTPRGGAWGFKLEALAKLDTVKDASGKRNLVDFLYDLCEANYPDLCDFELRAAKDAMDVSMSDLSSELNQLAGNMRAIKTELGNPPANKKDRFQKAMAGFEVKGAKRVADLQASFDKVRGEFQSLAKTFAETGSNVEPESFFAKFVKFEVALKRARRVVEEQRERAERARRLAEEKKRRATLKKMRDASGDDGVFAQYAKANAGDAKDIVQGFRQRNRGSASGPDDMAPARPARRSKGKAGKKKKKKLIKVIKEVNPDGTVTIKRVRMVKKKGAASSVPNADFDIA